MTSEQNSDGFDWGGTFGDLLDSGVGIFNAVKNKPKAPAPKPVAKSTTPAWLIPVAIGGGVLVLVLVLFGLKK